MKKDKIGQAQWQRTARTLVCAGEDLPSPTLCPRSKIRSVKASLGGFNPFSQHELATGLCHDFGQRDRGDLF